MTEENVTCCHIVKVRPMSRIVYTSFDAIIPVWKEVGTNQINIEQVMTPTLTH